MLEIHKQYVVDENGNAIAVQIPIDEFKQIEATLKHSEQVRFTVNSENHLDQAVATEQEKDPFEYKNGILVFNGTLEEGATPEDLELAVKRDREEQIRKQMSW